MSGSRLVDDVGKPYTIRFAQGKLRGRAGSLGKEMLRCAQYVTPESASFDAQLVLFEMLLGLAPTLQWCRAISATPASYQNPNHGLAGRVPIWKPRGTLISHIEEETWEAGITLTVSYM